MLPRSTSRPGAPAGPKQVEFHLLGFAAKVEGCYYSHSEHIDHLQPAEVKLQESGPG